jgi:hypothetical protein
MDIRTLNYEEISAINARARAARDHPEQPVRDPPVDFDGGFQKRSGGTRATRPTAMSDEDEKGGRCRCLC